MNRSPIRPSLMDRALECNLWAFLPNEKESQKKLDYLQARTDDHSRLERGEYLPHEEKTKEIVEEITKRCGKENIYREKEIKVDLRNDQGHVLTDIHFSGTIDFLGICPDKSEVHVLDFKTGKWPVYAQDNPQLMSYMTLVWHESQDNNWPPRDEEEEGIVLHNWKWFGYIANTQSGMISRHEYSSHKLSSHWCYIQKAVVATHEKRIYCHEGDHCRWCPAKKSCPLKNSSMFKEKVAEIKNH